MKKQPKTFAQRAKEIEKKFEGRNDNVSIRTKKALFADLRAEQEAVKAQREGNKYAGGGTLANGIVADAGVQSGLDGNAVENTVVQPNQNPTTIAPLTFNANQFNNGGAVSTLAFDPNMVDGKSVAGPSSSATPEGGPGAGAYLGAAKGALDIGKMAFGDSGIDTSGKTAAPTVKVGASAASGAMKGAQAGMAFGPWGAAIGGVVGGIGGLIGGGKAKKEADKARGQYDANLSNQYTPNTYADGGELDPPAKKFPTIHLPQNKPELSVDDNLDIRDSYASRMKLSPEQVKGFEDQRTSDTSYITQRDKDFQTSYKDWRKQKTGNSPNSKLSQSDPVYQKFWTDMRSDYSKNTPRPINEVVANYNLKGPAGKGQGIEFNQNIKNTLPTFDSARSREMLTDSNATGGMINKYEDGGTTKVGDWLRGIFKAPEGVDDDGNPLKSKAGKAVKAVGANLGTAASYAGILGDLTQKIDPAETPMGERVGTQYKKTPFDEQRLINQVNSTGVNRALTEASGGDAGALRTNLLAAHLNKQKALGAGMAQGDAVNRDEQQKANQFNLKRDMFNSQLNEKFLEREAADKGAYETAKQERRASLFGSVAEVGKEEVNKKLVKEMFGYKWNGKYWTDEKGKKVSADEVAASITKTNETKDKMFGGYLKK